MKEPVFWIKCLCTCIIDLIRSSLGRHKSDIGKDIIETLPQMEVSILTYAEVIEYFVIARPNDERITTGMILRQPRTGGKSGQLIIQCFVDTNLNPIHGPGRQPYGRVTIAHTLDNEFCTVFAGKDLIIVQ